MKSVLYTSYSALDCGCRTAVIMCVSAALTAANVPWLEGTIASVDVTYDCNGNTQYNYAVTYEEGNLADPSYNLVPGDITGMFCQSCLTDWVKAYVASVLPS